MTTRRWLATILVLVCFPATVPAEEKRRIEDYYIDFGVSELTALTLIGVNTNRVLRPGSMKSLATGFLTVAETGSDIKPGVAVEWTPVRPDESLAQYRDSKLKYLLLAFGTVKNRDATDFGFGARWNIFDRSDPLGNKSYHDRISAAVDTVLAVSQARDNELRMLFVERVKDYLLTLVARLEQQGTRSQKEIKKITDTLAGKIWNLDHAIWTLQGRYRDMVHFVDNVYKKRPLFPADVPNAYMPGKKNGKWGFYGYSKRTLDKNKFDEFKTINQETALPIVSAQCRYG